MIFVKSKNKRKNVITSLVVVLLMVGSITLDSSLEPSQQKQLDEFSYSESAEQAGWFWGKHKDKYNRRIYRVFGITVWRGGCV